MNEEKKKELGKYAVRPPKDLRSKFEMKMAKRAEDKRKADIQKKKDEEDEKIAVSKHFNTITVALTSDTVLASRVYKFNCLFYILTHHVVFLVMPNSKSVLC